MTRLTAARSCVAFRCSACGWLHNGGFEAHVIRDDLLSVVLCETCALLPVEELKTRLHSRILSLRAEADYLDEIVGGEIILPPASKWQQVKSGTATTEGMELFT